MDCKKDYISPNHARCIGHQLAFMLEVRCGLCKSFGPEVWIPDSKHLPSGKIALSCNQKRTLFSVLVTNVEFHLWSAFPLNIIDQNQSKKIGKHLSWKAFRLESILVPDCLYDFSLQRRNAVHTLEGYHWLSRETHLTLIFFFASLQRWKDFLSARAGVLSEGLLHFNPVFVYQC